MVATRDGEALARERRAVVEVSRELRALEALTVTQLRQRHLEWFGVETRTHNKAFLRKKLAYRLQERAEGGVSTEAMARLVELAPALLPARQARATPPPRPKHQAIASALATPRDPRLPAVGAFLRRGYHREVHEVEVLVQGFRFRGKVYPSLSSIAKLITGTNWNGFLFFGLAARNENA